MGYVGREVRVQNRIKALLMLCWLCWIPPLHAEDGAVSKPTASAEIAQESATPKEKKEGFSLFWIVFGVSILFVLSSATALNRLGGKPPSRSEGGTLRPRKESGDEEERRFRL